MISIVVRAHYLQSARDFMNTRAFKKYTYASNLESLPFLEVGL